MNKVFTALTALVAIAMAVPAAADECVMTTSAPEVTLDTGVGVAGTGTFYVDNDDCQPGCLFSTWVYEESNGIDGLQRGDEVVDDTCGGTAAVSDFIWF